VFLSGGVPIVSSLKGELAALLADHDCGLTYRNSQSDELAQAIIELVDNPVRRQRMSDNAASLYRSHFVAEEVYSQMHDYLNEVASMAVAGPSARVA